MASIGIETVMQKGKRAKRLGQFSFQIQCVAVESRQQYMVHKLEPQLHSYSLGKYSAPTTHS